MSGAARVLALAALTLGCSRAPAADRGAGEASQSASASASTSASASGSSSAKIAVGRAPSPAPSARPARPAPTADELTATTRALAAATLGDLRAGAGRERADGIFEAAIAGAGIPAEARAEVRIALVDAPIVHRRRLAFHRLAAALGAHVVAGCVERSLTVRELVERARDDRASLDVLEKRAAIRNDGTVATLLMALAPDAHGGPWSRPIGAPLDPYGGGEPGRWSRWIEAASPEADEVATLARDWLEMIALDYLAATSHRRSVFVVRDGDARGRGIGLVLLDNVNAFSPAPARTASSALLKRLTLAERFPRALRDGLVGLTPARTKSIFAPGSFETWLLPPRALVELEERRAALLSLIEAKIAGRGEAAVLTD